MKIFLLPTEESSRLQDYAESCLYIIVPVCLLLKILTQRTFTHLKTNTELSQSFTEEGAVWKHVIYSFRETLTLSHICSVHFSVMQGENKAESFLLH